MNNEYDVEISQNNQRDFCDKNNLPNFSGNGRCHSCGRNIYEEGGLTIIESKSKLVTGCPFCFSSFVDWYGNRNN